MIINVIEAPFLNHVEERILILRLSLCLYSVAHFTIEVLYNTFGVRYRQVTNLLQEYDYTPGTNKIK